MFLPFDFRSVNERNTVGIRNLVGVCSHYRCVDNKANIQVYEYWDATTQRSIAGDIVIYDADGAIYAHDMLCLDDGNWRDAYGQVSATFEQLLPSVMTGAILLGREPITQFCSEY